MLTRNGESRQLCIKSPTLCVLLAIVYTQNNDKILSALSYYATLSAKTKRNGFTFTRLRPHSSVSHRVAPDHDQVPQNQTCTQILEEKKTQKGSLSFSAHLRLDIKDAGAECLQERWRGTILLGTHCSAAPTLLNGSACALFGLAMVGSDGELAMMTDIWRPQRPPPKRIITEWLRGRG